MFGMGFTEILIIAVIAILFLGPDKLPSAMIDIAKFLKNAKNTIGSVKESIEEEINVKDMKEEALAYKQELLSAGEQVKSATDVKKMAAELTSLELDEDYEDDGFFDEPKPEEVTIKKKKKKKEKDESKDV
ncbi:Sec-independent protein translocase protein TatB [Sulfurimonas sp.]|nr:Sec-independent protein translocase protein TatB [Sulfurimonas sp.]